MATATYTPIATQTLGSSAANVTFSSISGSYTDLIIVASAYASSADTSIEVYYNGSASSGLYSETILDGDGSTASSARESNVNAAALGSVGTSQSVSIIQIQNYSNTTTYKTALGRGNNINNRVRAYVGLWRNTAAITSVTLYLTGSANFGSGSTFTLYGIKAA